MKATPLSKICNGHPAIPLQKTVKPNSGTKSSIPGSGTDARVAAKKACF
jgi:hypothetical protein